ncbi:dynamin family protein [Streptosporangiaceae bacterium NEAU-GS5]|nr:dynamin family protein [Streptosporangiaceae bacterium NEAU-GS5]
MAITLIGVLAGLASHLNVLDRDHLSELEHRLRRSRLRVVVAGQAGCGKSTLLNALLGRPVLPVGDGPPTTLPVALTFGPDEHVDVAFADGRRELRPLPDLPDLVGDRGNPGNRQCVARVVVELDDPLLGKGVEMVDTAGATSGALETVLEAGAATMVVLTADTMNAGAALLKHAASAPGSLFVVLNKIDLLGPGELDEAMAAIRDTAGAQIRLYPLSARDAGPGFERFADDFAAFLDRERMGDLHASVARSADALTRRRLDEVRLALCLDELEETGSGEAAERIARFRERLAEVRVRRSGAADAVRDEGGRLLDEIADSATLLAGDLAVQLRADLTDGLPRGLGATADVEQLGRERAMAVVRAEVEAWQARWQRRLPQDVDALGARLREDLDRALSDVRAAAFQLLDLELDVPSGEEHLVGDPRFFYDLTVPTGPADIPVGAVRRRLPSRLGDRLGGRGRMLRMAADLVDEQVEQSRRDLQYRLAEGVRQLVRAVEACYDDAGVRLLAVVDGGTPRPPQPGMSPQARRAALEREATELTDLLTELSDLASPR